MKKIINTNVIRGIAVTVYGKGYKKIAIETPQHIYKLNNGVMRFPLREDDKVLGVVVNNEFNICYSVTLESNEKIFGYFSKNNKDVSMGFQTVKDFNKFSYDPYKPLYPLGKEIKITIRQITDMEVDFNKMFKSEFKN